jgi:hypothetical protein
MTAELELAPDVHAQIKRLSAEGDTLVDARRLQDAIAKYN